MLCIYGSEGATTHAMLQVVPNHVIPSNSVPSWSYLAYHNPIAYSDQEY